MSFIKEIRMRARYVIGPVLGIFAVTYFSFHAVQGDRGLMSWLKLHQHIEVASVSLKEITKEQIELERRVRLLHPESLDPDMLEERARIMLNYGHIDDIVALDQKRRK
jgi:cell division protein FtsB